MPGALEHLARAALTGPRTPMVDRDSGRKRAAWASPRERSGAREREHGPRRHWRTRCQLCHHRARTLAPILSTWPEPTPPARRVIRPARQRAPAVPARVVVVALPELHPRAHTPSRHALRPQRERHRDGNGAVQHPAQHATRRHDDHCTAPTTPVAPKQQRELLGGAIWRYWTRQRPRAHTMADEPERSAHRGTGQAATRAAVRPCRAHRRRRSRPKFDFDVGVDDS